MIFLSESIYTLVKRVRKSQQDNSNTLQDDFVYFAETVRFSGGRAATMLQRESIELCRRQSGNIEIRFRSLSALWQARRKSEDS